MAFDESLYVTAKFTTAKGLSLSKQSNALTIKDTSIPITYTAGFFTNNLATTPMSSVNEGGTAYIVLTTTGVPDNTYLDWEVTGAGITLDDTGSTVMSGQAMIRNNTYWATIKPKLDLLTEGNETLKITFKRGGVIVASASIVINDTSSGSIGDIGFYRHLWGADNLQHRRVFQTYIGPKVTYNSGGINVDAYSRSGFSNGFKWDFTQTQPIIGTAGGPAVVAILTATTLVYDSTIVSESLGLSINITRPNGDGVLHKSVTIVFRNLRTNVLHSFTFQRGVTYGTGGTYHENTSQFKDLGARIEAIGTYGDRVEIESVTIT